MDILFDHNLSSQATSKEAIKIKIELPDFK
jgi:hypothetical protein